MESTCAILYPDFVDYVGVSILFSSLPNKGVNALCFKLLGFLHVLGENQMMYGEEKY